MNKMNEFLKAKNLLKSNFSNISEGISFCMTETPQHQKKIYTENTIKSSASAKKYENLLITLDHLK